MVTQVPGTSCGDVSGGGPHQSSVHYCARIVSTLIITFAQPTYTLAFTLGRLHLALLYKSVVHQHC